ncbi:MAG TPA: cytochrome b/b6 domain-containing protein [Burkholderiales bacterium]|nr:cytochrome b/b6 domain-containing protein [Burkholderiales bacterium]
MPNGRDGEARASERVWDLPVRLFHWLLVALIATSWITAEIGGNAMQYHQWSGMSILTLVLFRVLWGFFGSTRARFSDFVRGPRTALAYACGLVRGGTAFYPGHNPLGGWMVVALLASLRVQTATGLFANDDIMIEGPLARHVSKETSDWLTGIHHINFAVLTVLIAVHVAAALFYLLVKRDNLVLPMITGRKPIAEGRGFEPPRGGPLWLAVLLLALCAGAVWGIVTA